MKKVLVAVLAIIVFAIVSHAASSKEPLKPKIISPNKTSVWYEGKTYTIKWQGLKEGVICIELLLGGHDAGTINECNSCALQGQFKWKVPKGQVTGFGIDKLDVARIAIYYKDNESNIIYSDYFTIEK